MSNLLGRPLLLLPYVLPTLGCKYTFLLLAFYIYQGISSAFNLKHGVETAALSNIYLKEMLWVHDFVNCDLDWCLQNVKALVVLPTPSPPAHLQDGEFTLKLHKRMQIYHLMQIWRNLLARQVLLLSICEADVKQSQRLLIDWKRCHARSWLSPGLEVICQLLSGACY